MWWGERADRGAALLVQLQADALSLGWLAPASSAQPARWRSVQVPMAADFAPVAPGDALAAAAARRQALREACRAVAGQWGQGPVAEAPPAGLGMVVLAAPPWLNEVVMPWTDALLRAGPAQDQARAQLLAHGWTPGIDDELRIDPRPGLGRARAVLHLPVWLPQELQALAQTLGLRWWGLQSLVAVAARWAARQPLAAGQAASPWVGLWSDGLLRLVSRDGTPALVGAEWVDDALPTGPVPDPPALRVARLWRRACLRYPGLQAGVLPPLLSLDAAPAAPAAGSSPALHWVRWPAPGQDRTALDRALLQEALRYKAAALPPAAPSALLWRRLAVAGSLVGALGLGWQAVQYHRAVPAAGLPAPPVSVAAAEPPGKAELAELRVVNAAVGRINLALLPLLRALQPPPDIHVALLGLDLAPARAGVAETDALAGPAATPVKLDIEARAAPDMTRYLAYLGSRPGLAGVQLMRHEPGTAGPASGYRFHVEMSWQP